MRILGLIGRGACQECHDAAVALVVDGELVFAVEQERLSGHRHAPGEGAEDAAAYCLEQMDLTLSDVDHVAYGWLEDFHEPALFLSRDIAVSREYSQAIVPKERFGWHVPPPIHFVRHHLAHAAASFYTAPVDSAAVLILDGQGETESISLYQADARGIRRLETHPIACSLGLMYEAAAYYAGLGWDAAGKLMGLTSFGRPRSWSAFGYDPISERFSLPPKIEGARGPDLDIAWAWLDYFGKHHYPYQNGDGKDVAYYADFAATVQLALERTGLALAKRLKDLTGEAALVLGGGCGLNCLMNARLAASGLFETVYGFPAANDAGCAAGAALLAYRLLAGREPIHKPFSPFLGGKPSQEEIEAAFARHGLRPERLDLEALTERAAGDLAAGAMVAWFQGREEFGPRALGARSFLADPGRRDTLTRLNRIKGRAIWRPLAPSVLAEYAEELFEGPGDRLLDLYMLGMRTVKAAWRARIPAVVHVDYSTRPQVVTQQLNEPYWRLLDTFRSKTGIPLVCNTSLNVAGQPLAHTPDDALTIFTGQEDVGALVLGGFYITKSG